MLLGGFANSAPVITSSSTAEATTKVKTKKKTTTKKSTKKKTKIKVDSNRKKKNRAVKFVKKTTKNQISTASIFIYINQNDPNYQTVQDAIKAWNATKVIKFKQVF